MASALRHALNHLYYSSQLYIIRKLSFKPPARAKKDQYLRLSSFQYVHKLVKLVKLECKNTDVQGWEACERDGSDSDCSLACQSFHLPTLDGTSGWSTGIHEVLTYLLQHSWSAWARSSCKRNVSKRSGPLGICCRIGNAYGVDRRGQTGRVQGGCELRTKLA